MPNKVYRTAIYTRLSREDGDKAESNSIASQRVLCEEYIKNHSDLELVKTFVDDGWSGVNFDRPNFKRKRQMRNRQTFYGVWRFGLDLRFIELQVENKE